MKSALLVAAGKVADEAIEALCANLAGDVMKMKLAIVVSLAATLNVFSSPLRAQSSEILSVAPIQAEVQCQLFESWWGWWMVIECRNNFQAIATRISDAIAETGQYTVVGRNSRQNELEVRGLITELGVMQSGFNSGNSAGVVNSAVGRLDVALVESRTNRIVVARTITAMAEIDAAAATGLGSDSNGLSSRAAYDLIQRKLALGAARMAAFYRRPLQVAAVDGRDITLNHGGSILPLGALVMVQRNSGHPVRYRITASGSAGAVAEIDGSSGVVSVGQRVDFIEEDDAQNNGRRYRRIELPGL